MQTLQTARAESIYVRRVGGIALDGVRERGAGSTDPPFISPLGFTMTPALSSK